MNKDLEASMEKLSSGMRINSAADDAAGMAISSRMNAEIKGIDMAIRNASDAQALINTAEGAQQEVEIILQRARELAVQASNDTNSEEDRANLQLEIDALMTEIDRVSENTAWGGKSLLGGDDNGAMEFRFQVGSGQSGSDAISVAINSTSSESLGIGHTGPASGGRDVGPAGISYSDGLITVVGTPEQGDEVSITLNGIEITTTFSGVDQFSNDAAGFASQLKAEIDEQVAADANSTTLAGITVTDNGDGTLSLEQPTRVMIDTFVADTNTAEIIEENGTVTFSDFTEEEITLNINGTTVSVTREADDGFTQDDIGTAAAFKQAITDIQTNGDSEALQNVVVTDHADGSLTIVQSAAPHVEGAEVRLTADPTIAIEYDDADTLTVSGAFEEGQVVSLDVFGETVSFTVQDDDAYENTLAGVTAQLASAINDAGIIGLSAEKNDNANTVTLTADVLVQDAIVNNGDSFITHTIGEAGTVELALVSEANTLIADEADAIDTPADGDSYTFSVLGHEVTLVVGTDGYTDDAVGVSEQMKDLIDALGIEGLEVTANDDNAANSGVSLTRSLTGTGGGDAAAGSTVITNITSLSSDEAGDPTFSGAISVTTSAAALNALDRIDAALFTLNTQRADLGAVSNRLDYTMNNLSNVSSNLQGSLSRIQDADFATETAELTKNQIMSQAATAMLAQANASKQGVLSLLQG